MAQADPRAILINASLDRHRLSYRWLAERMDVTHRTVSKWLNGEARPRDEAVWRAMVEVLKDYESHARGTGHVEVKRAGIRQIPVYPGLSAGPANSLTSDVSFMDVKDLGTGREQWGRVIDGYSMSPLLEPGDIVVFEARPAQPYHVVHAFVGEVDTVKVHLRQKSTVSLIPLNPDYDPVEGGPMEIRGVAVMRIRMGAHDEVTTTEYPHGMFARELLK